MSPSHLGLLCQGRKRCGGRGQRFEYTNNLGARNRAVSEGAGIPSLGFLLFKEKMTTPMVISAASTYSLQG